MCFANTRSAATPSNHFSLVVIPFPFVISRPLTAARHPDPGPGFGRGFFWRLLTPTPRALTIAPAMPGSPDAALIAAGHEVKALIAEIQALQAQLSTGGRAVHTVGESLRIAQTRLEEVYAIIITADAHTLEGAVVQLQLARDLMAHGGVWQEKTVKRLVVSAVAFFEGSAAPAEWGGRFSWVQLAPELAPDGSRQARHKLRQRPLVPRVPHGYPGSRQRAPRARAGPYRGLLFAPR